ncbi:hypothetical protein C8Q70DRAFT_170877 [Cubamyces menziesii]|nr:hypothetical protein C8Q70DRAFT_170877 [Cubamyces menziesii]
MCIVMHGRTTMYGGKDDDVLHVHLDSFNDKEGGHGYSAWVCSIVRCLMRPGKACPMSGRWKEVWTGTMKALRRQWLGGCATSLDERDDEAACRRVQRWKDQLASTRSKFVVNCRWQLNAGGLPRGASSWPGLGDWEMNQISPHFLHLVSDSLRSWARYTSRIAQKLGSTKKKQHRNKQRHCYDGKQGKAVKLRKTKGRTQALVASRCQPRLGAPLSAQFHCRPPPIQRKTLCAGSGTGLFQSSR